MGQVAKTAAKVVLSAAMGLSMSAFDDRVGTARDRRSRIVEALRREMNLERDSSAASRFNELLAEDRVMVVSGDIDGIVSAMMLADIAGWRAGAIVVRSDTVLLHPDYEDLCALLGTPSFGVDIFSTRFPNVSNHPVIWGNKGFAEVPNAAEITEAYDNAIRQSLIQHPVINPSLWAEIHGAVYNNARPESNYYRYPLGSAQLVVAALEVIGRAPRMYEREYLPWLVAHCDGGLDSIREYSFNVPMWWAALAGAVGHASISEFLYTLASTQRPNQFPDVRNQLHHEDPTVGEILGEKWNVTGELVETVPPVIRWISDLSGWPDPFRGGADNLRQWESVAPTRGSLSVSGTPVPPPGQNGVEPAEALRLHLDNALDAIHAGFSHYWEGRSLGWMLPH